MKLNPIAAALAATLIFPAALLATAGSASAVTPHVVTLAFHDPADTAATHEVPCPAGEHATGGGASISDNRRNYISESYPTEGAKGWKVTTAPINANRDARDVVIYAVCT